MADKYTNSHRPCFLTNTSGSSTHTVLEDCMRGIFAYVNQGKRLIPKLTLCRAQI